MTEEMRKLRQMLDEREIEYTDASNEGFLPMTRTHFTYEGNFWSVIHGYGSYGGYSQFNDDEGLLELMTNAVNGGDPVGHLTAEEVIEYMEGGLAS